MYDCLVREVVGEVASRGVQDSLRVSLGVLVVNRAEVHRDLLSRLHEKIALRLAVLGLVGPETQPSHQPRQHRSRDQAGDQRDPLDLTRGLDRPDI